MKINEYIKLLQNVAEVNGNLDIIYSHDEEGNYYQNVNIGPCLVFVDEIDFNHDCMEYALGIDDVTDKQKRELKKVICIN